MSGLHWSTERHAHTPQRTCQCLVRPDFRARSLDILLQASGLLELRLSVVRSPLSAMFLSLHWLLHFSPPHVQRERLAMPGARTSAAAKGERQRVSQIQAHSGTHRREIYTTGGSDEREAEAREPERAKCSLKVCYAARGAHPSPLCHGFI